MGENITQHGFEEEIGSPGEYKFASSRAPACCGPHLASVLPFSRCSDDPASGPHPSSFTSLAIIYFSSAKPYTDRPSPSTSPHSKEAPTES